MQVEHVRLDTRKGPCQLVDSNPQPSCTTRCGTNQCISRNVVIKRKIFYEYLLWHFRPIQNTFLNKEILTCIIKIYGIYVAPEYKKQFSTDRVNKSGHAQQRNLSFNFISMKNTVLATRIHWKNDFVFSSVTEICETRRLCVCSCSLPHPTTPCAVSIAGWSWYNCTRFKRALKLHSLYFPSP